MRVAGSLLLLCSSLSAVVVVFAEEDYSNTPIILGAGVDDAVATMSGSSSTPRMLRSSSPRQLQEQQQPQQQQQQQLPSEPKQKPLIPPQLWFAHESNILQTKKPQLLYDNVQKTIEAYRRGFGMVNPPPFQFLDRNDCYSEIYDHNKDLAEVFQREDMNWRERGDICRTVILYKYGGYYFDIDLDVLVPFIPPPTISFSSVIDPKNEVLLTSFVASSPNHPILENAMETMLAWYKARVTGVDKQIIPVQSMYMAYDETDDETLEQTYMLEEVRLHDGGTKGMYPTFPKQIGDGQCNYVIHDKKDQGTVYFYTRFLGSPHCSHPDPKMKAMYERGTLPKGVRNGNTNNQDISNGNITTTEEINTKIPHSFIFTYSHNILVERQPRMFYNNIMKTMDAYRTLWGEPDAPVRFLDDVDCLNEIRSYSPRLAEYYAKEVSGAEKGDVCRSVVLYKYGGYYMDLDMEVIEPYNPPSDVDFLSVSSQGGNIVFNAFIASSPQHPIMKETVDNMLAWYEMSKNPHMIGPHTMVDAYWQVSDAVRDTSYMLEEIRLEVEDEDGYDEEGRPIKYPSVPRQAGFGNCNYVVHDVETHKVYFYSRFLGTPACEPFELLNPRELPKPNIPNSLWFTDEANLLFTRDPPMAYNNVMRTFNLYKDAWYGVDRPPLTFLDDYACEKKIRVVKKELLPYFMEEEVGTVKADLCRVATIYLHGGYYFDVDLYPVEPVLPDPTTDFVAVKGCNGGCFNPAFLAAKAGNSVLQLALHKIFMGYENGEETTMLTSISLANAYYELSEEERGKSLILEELKLDEKDKEVDGDGDGEVMYPNVPRMVGINSGKPEQNCNFVVHSEEKKELYFFHTFLGYGGCVPMDNKY